MYVRDDYTTPDFCCDSLVNLTRHRDLCTTTPEFIIHTIDLTDLPSSTHLHPDLYPFCSCYIVYDHKWTSGVVPARCALMRLATPAPHVLSDFFRDQDTSHLINETLDAYRPDLTKRYREPLTGRDQEELDIPVARA
jgi:hypothetical protein